MMELKKKKVLIKITIKKRRQFYEELMKRKETHLDGILTFIIVYLIGSKI
jgi:hypothetical protein